MNRGVFLRSVTFCAMDSLFMKIRQIVLVFENVSEALTFYTEKLSLKFLFSPSPELAFLEADGLRLMLCEPRGYGKPGQNSILYLQVEDVETLYNSLMESGVSGERAPQMTATLQDHELWIGFIRDPENNLLGLVEEKRFP